MGHSSHEDLVKALSEAEKLIKVGDTYFHYKHPDQFYKIESLGFLEATEEVCVCYRWLYGPKLLFIRPISNFLSEVEVDGKKIARFKIVEK